MTGLTWVTEHGGVGSGCGSCDSGGVMAGKCDRSCCGEGRQSVPVVRLSEACWRWRRAGQPLILGVGALKPAGMGCGTPAVKGYVGWQPTRTSSRRGVVVVMVVVVMVVMVVVCRREKCRMEGASNVMTATKACALFPPSAKDLSRMNRDAGR
jgi:hypothetical protein